MIYGAVHKKILVRRLRLLFSFVGGICQHTIILQCIVSFIIIILCRYNRRQLTRNNIIKILPNAVFTLTSTTNIGWRMLAAYIRITFIIVLEYIRIADKTYTHIVTGEGGSAYIIRAKGRRQNANEEKSTGE